MGNKLDRPILTQQQIDDLWGGTGPYSQAHLIKEERILDDSLSRVFLIVEVDINPTTFEFIRDHRNDAELADDEEIQQLLDHSEDRRPFSGYVSMSFMGEYRDETVLEMAELVLVRSRAMIVKMHRYFMQRHGMLPMGN